MRRKSRLRRPGVRFVDEDLPVFVHWFGFVKWLLPVTEKFPKGVRFTFSNRIDNLALSTGPHPVSA
jgi:hypothetical protein